MLMELPNFKIKNIQEVMGTWALPILQQLSVVSVGVSVRVSSYKK